MDATARGKRSNLRNQGPAVRDPSSRHEEEWKTNAHPGERAGGEASDDGERVPLLGECVCQSYGHLPSKLASHPPLSILFLFYVFLPPSPHVESYELFLQPNLLQLVVPENSNSRFAYATQRKDRLRTNIRNLGRSYPGKPG